MTSSVWVVAEPSLRGGDGDDTITVAGNSTQWLVDAGSGADSIRHKACSEIIRVGW